MWVGLIQSVEDLKTNNWSFPEKKKILPQDHDMKIPSGFPAFWPSLQILDSKLHLNSYLNFQTVSLPYRFHTC